MTEQEITARARKQLILAGVVCISTIIFVLWIVHLRATLTYADQKASATPLIESFKATQQQLGPQWEQFKNQLTNLD